jgi:hypothetical protein
MVDQNSIINIVENIKSETTRKIMKKLLSQNAIFSLEK